jgi:hypothetical protein
MIAMQRILKFCTWLVVGVTASGCIVLPYGAGHGRHHHRGSYSEPRGDARSYPDDGARPERGYGRGR